LLQVEIPYSPRSHQRRVHGLIEANRFAVLVQHRRAGKTVLAVNDSIKAILSCPHRHAQGLYVAPFRNQAKRVAWKYYLHYTRNIPGMTYNQTELSIGFANGATIMLGGADAPDVYRGMYFDHVVMDEYAQFPPRLWTQVIRPALADRQGRMLCIGTPAGRNSFFRMYKDAEGLEGWCRDYLPVSMTNVLDPKELAAIRREMPANEYAQEFELSWTAAITGAIYGKEMSEAESEGRITKVPYDKALLVHTSWDLGIRDSIVWLWQVAGSEVRAIGCRHYEGRSLPDIIADLRTLPYQWGDHVAPHDIAVREYGTGVTRLEQAQGLGWDFEVCPMIPVEDGINAFKSLIPRVWFDQVACADGIEALIQYRVDYDEIDRVFSTKPAPDWTRHPADAARMFAVAKGRGQSAFSWGRRKADWSAQDRTVI
jgi:hypothetical protein